MIIDNKSDQKYEETQIPQKWNGTVLQNGNDSNDGQMTNS